MLSAYLIEAHSKFEQLLLLLETLDYPNNDIYIHIDLKSEIPDYIKFFKPKYSKFYLLDDRVNVQWGSSSQIKVEYELIDKAINTRKYDRLHLISGVDFPIKSQEYIQDFFKKNNDIEFVHFDSIQNEKEILKRVGKYFVFIDKYGRSSKLLSCLQNIIVGFQYCLFINRVKHEEKKFYKGSNWFSITGEFARYIVENKDWIYKTFNKTKCCDEIFLQTLLMNSKFKDNVYYDNKEKRYSNMRLIDWNLGNPYVFLKKDYDRLISSDCLFARKFDIDVDKEIIMNLYRLGRDENEKKEK